MRNIYQYLLMIEVAVPDFPTLTARRDISYLTVSEYNLNPSVVFPAIVQELNSSDFNISYHNP